MTFNHFTKHFCTALLACGMATPVLAEYRDAIDLPALKKASAPRSLLLDVAKAGDSLVMVGERGHILKSTQGPAGPLDWEQVEVPTRLQLNAVTFVDAPHGWAVGEDELILATSDGGRSWQKQHQDVDADIKGPLLDVLFTSSQEGIAVGVFNKIFHTRDGGNSWQNWQEHIENWDEWHLFALAATGADNERIYITSEKGLLFISDDGGETFVPLQTDHDGSFHGILARRGPDGKDRLVLMGVGGILYTSHDGGDSWNQPDTGTDAGLASGDWLADGSVLIVGADGVVLHLDSGLQRVSRYETDNGLPLSSVVQLNANTLLLVGMGGIKTFRLE